MDLVSFHSSEIFAYLVLPLLIFFARIIDVSIGTMRVIFISRGYKLFASFFGFFEILVWLLAMTQIMKNLTNVLYYLTYACGFAAGNFVGILIEEKIALGNVLVRVISKEKLVDLEKYLKSNNFRITLLNAQGFDGDVLILYTIIPRQKIKEVVAFIKHVNPELFYTIEDVRYVSERRPDLKKPIGINKKTRSFLGPFRQGMRKGK